MTALLDHSWGESPAADRVWSHVTGLSPARAGQRLLVTLQAFIDDSYTRGGVFVLGGYIAAAETWAHFSKAWEELLPLGTRAKNGKFHFKMSEMARHMDRVRAFYNVIENHDLIEVWCKIDEGDIERAKARILIPGTEIDWAYFNRPFTLAYRCLLDVFHANRVKGATILPLSEKIDFIFDNHSEKKQILDAWDGYLAARPEAIRNWYGATPRFEDDQDFLPLQAADLIAWWIRKWHEQGMIPLGTNQPRDFGAWKGGSPPTGIGMDVGENQFVDFMISQLREVIAQDQPIFDLGFYPPRQR